MATTVHTIEPKARNEIAEESRRLYYAYRHAKALWDAAMYSPEYVDADLPDEISDPLSDAHTHALDAFLLAPAGDAKQLAKKLAVFRDEEIFHGWHRAAEVAAAMAQDAHSLAWPD